MRNGHLHHGRFLIFEADNLAIKLLKSGIQLNNFFVHFGV